MPAAALAIQVAPDAGLVTSRQIPSALADMRAFLARSGQLTASESLRLLRNAYPDTPLSVRVAAAGASHG